MTNAMIEIPLSDANDLDAVIHELGIEDSDTTPAEAVRQLKAEIVRLRAELSATQERISELYRAQKSTILSAKSVEYDIDALLAAARQDAETIARLREALSFYAQRHAWFNAIIPNDQGERARTALKADAAKGGK